MTTAMTAMATTMPDSHNDSNDSNASRVGYGNNFIYLIFKQLTRRRRLKIEEESVNI